MDFKQYEYVLMVAEEKSFSKAAKKLYISQPSLSQYIGRIESNLGINLFNRYVSPLSLTYEGRIYVDTAKKIMNLSNAMLKAFDDVRELKKGRLNVGFTSGGANYPMASVIPVFRREYPDIDLIVTESFSEDLEDMMLSGAADICLMNPPLLNENIEWEPIMTERILLAAPPDTAILPSEEFSVINIADIADESFILYKCGLTMHRILNSFFIASGFKPGAVSETTSIDTSIGLAAAGLGFAFVPESAAVYSKDMKTPKYYVIGEPPLSCTLALAYKKDSYISAAARAFADITKRVVAETHCNKL